MFGNRCPKCAHIYSTSIFALQIHLTGLSGVGSMSLARVKVELAHGLICVVCPAYSTYSTYSTCRKRGSIRKKVLPQQWNDSTPLKFSETPSLRDCKLRELRSALHVILQHAVGRLGGRLVSHWFPVHRASPVSFSDMEFIVLSCSCSNETSTPKNQLSSGGSTLRSTWTSRRPGKTSRKQQKKDRFRKLNVNSLDEDE